MRRSITALSLFASLALVACEDGPAQTYNPSPNGAGDKWNNGGTPAATDQAKQNFDVQGGGTNKQELCDAPTKAATWKKMVKQPIIPPTTGGGINISGGDDWHGLTIEEAEKTLCQSTNLGDQFGNGSRVNAWGDNNELWMDYRVSTRKARWLNMWAGYIGTVDFESPDGAHKFSIPVNSQLQKDGKPLTLDWVGGGGKNFEPVADEMYRGLMHQFAPAIPNAPDGVTCFQTGRCIKGSFGDVAYWYVPAIGFAMWVDNQNAAQPVPSIMTRFDIDLAKTMAYSFANAQLKMDAEGPLGKAGELKAGAGECTLKIGLTFGDFLSKCVQTTSDGTKDKIELNKLLGGLAHGTERFSFDLTGIDVNFTDITLAPDNIIRDGDVPTADDKSTYFDVDQSTLGTILNDFAPDGKTLDLHGAGAVYKEYARLVRKTLLESRGVADGDVSKCSYPVGWDSAGSTFDPDTFAPPAYCTGFEGFITAAPGPATDATNLGTDALLASSPAGNVGKKLQTGLKPGHQKVVFCNDANGDKTKSASGKSFTTGYHSCSQGDNFSTSFNRVVKVFGKGKIGSLPTEAQDVRLYWRLYFQALTKYMIVGNTIPVPDLSTVKLDPDQIFYDSIGAGQFEIGEYVDRTNASKTVDPIDFEVSADVKNGIFSTYSFSRDLYRGESALYAAVLEDQSHGIGQENHALLTNLFGSPVLKAAYTDSAKGKSAYYCATKMDLANCGGQTPPTDAAGDPLLDELGRPILYGYPGAFKSTVFALGPTTVQVKSTNAALQAATISVPITTNPYDPASDPLPSYQVLIPWLPKQPGIGFPLSINGSIDKFISTAQLDLSGTTITANLDYDFQIDPATHKPTKDGSIEFKAVETTDFLGKVFLCQDPASSDILWASMYTPVANILDWLESHPGTYSACQMVIRYSPFGNYADYITSLTNGVRLGITQGGGFGRVVDATLFVPGQ